MVKRDLLGSHHQGSEVAKADWAPSPVQGNSVVVAASRTLFLVPKEGTAVYRSLLSPMRWHSLAGRLTQELHLIYNVQGVNVCLSCHSISSTGIPPVPYLSSTSRLKMSLHGPAIREKEGFPFFDQECIFGPISIKYPNIMKN